MSIELEDFVRLGLSTPTPEVLVLVQAMYAASPMNVLGVEAARANASKRRTAPEREEVHSLAELEIPVKDGRIALRVYRPSAETILPAIVYFHAGGWILGDLNHSDHLCRRMANRTGTVVINVEYRLVPEVSFPTPLDDCVSAVRWVRDNAKEIGCDPERIALAGESSGGNLAASVALELSSQEFFLKFLLLLEPALDMHQRTESWREMGSSFAPKKEQMAWMWSLYAPDPEMKDNLRVSPSQVKKIPEMHPPTLVLAAEYDPLRDEALAYAEKLQQAGIFVTARIERGLTHAFCNMGGVLPLGRQKFDAAIAEMKQTLWEEKQDGI